MIREEGEELEREIYNKFSQVRRKFGAVRKVVGGRRFGMNRRVEAFVQKGEARWSRT